MLAAVDWGAFWTTAIGAAIGASAAIVGGLIAGWYQLQGGREARQAAREDETQTQRDADLRTLGDVTNKIYHGCGKVALARRDQQPFMDDWHETMANSMRALQLISLLGDDELGEAVGKFLEIATVFGIEKPRGNDGAALGRPR